MISPTQRSLARARRLGWEAAVVEKWVTIPGMPGGGIRRDMGGFADLVLWGTPSPREGWLPLTSRDGTCRTERVIVVDRQRGILAVQACAGSGLAAHRMKLLAEPRLRSWLESGGRCSIWAWRKLSVVKKDGKKGKTKRYECREEELLLEHFDQPGESFPAGTASPERSATAGSLGKGDPA